MDKQRVAVIAVHGVAEHQPGDTARAVVELLVSSAPEGVCYTSSSTQALTLRVAPLAPQPRAHRPAAPHDGLAPPGEDRSLAKSFARSGRSDFQRGEWRTPQAAETDPASGRPAPAGAAEDEIDRGISISNYLLTKHRDNGARAEAYDTTRIDLLRHEADPRDVGACDDGEAARVDVFEMHWADLSRLSGAVPRIVSELFTMVFRLSKLGRETVDEAWGKLARSRDPSRPRARLFSVAWAIAGGLQIGLDWLFVNGLALLFTQLALLAIVFTTLGFASGIDESWLHRGVAFALAVFSLLRFMYRRGDGRFWQAALPVVASCAALAGLIAAPVLLQWVTAFALLAALTLLNEFALGVADDRFPFVRVVGRWLWIASTLLMFASAFYETRQAGTSVVWRDTWVHAALFATEVVLWLVKCWWILVGALLVAWLAAGLVAEREAGYASRASIATGRLGIAVSFGMFLVASMTIWAMLEGLLGSAVDGVGYRPCIFALEPRDAATMGPPYAPNACLLSTAKAAEAGRSLTGAAMPSARAVLDDRYRRSTSAFSALAALLVGLLLYLLVMFAPSVLAELKLLVERGRDASRRPAGRGGGDAQSQARAERARELGRWLTIGYRRLDMAVLWVAVGGVALSAGIAALFAATIFDSVGARTLPGILEQVATDTTQALLKPLIFSAAGLSAALSLLGGTLSRRIPSLRGPLDIALDVDNHFREFPRANIPRAHIFSRYAALLDHVAAKGYDRIVIVAHSQGSVISAELLRFLSSRRHRAPGAGDLPRREGRELPPISLLTVGCPLRQLYAARFPGLYAWVLARNGEVFGPRAADIGVQRWMNAFCSGDYVGRWLWSKADPEEMLSHPMVNAVHREPFGRQDAYAGFRPAPPDEAPLKAAREVEVCLGLGAHTHYFERDQTTVAWMLDYLIRADPVPAPRREGAAGARK